MSYLSEQIPGPDNRWHGDNRGGWANADYDRFVNAFMTTLDRAGRIRQLAQAAGVLNQDAAVVPLTFNVYVVPHVAALKGPIARHVPVSGDTFLHIETWEWRS